MLGLLVLAVLLTGAAGALVQGALPSGATVTFMGGGLVSLTLTDTHTPLRTDTEPQGGTTVSGQVTLTAGGAVSGERHREGQRRRRRRGGLLGFPWSASRLHSNSTRS